MSNNFCTKVRVRREKTTRKSLGCTAFLVSLSLTLAGGFPEEAVNLSLKLREGEVPFQVLYEMLYEDKFGVLR